MELALVFELPLELLPARGLDQSMLLPVLIGLLVVLFFTEVFGWVFAGAVVPGYLASVLVIQPVTGCIVIFESIVTLLISAALAKFVSKSDVWTRFFGRERFFLILVISLFVRIHDHAWFAPWAVAQLDQLFPWELEIQQEFYSVGLVLVPLTANMLWKPSLPRGMLQLGVEVGITYLIVMYVLLPYTNLSLSSVELTYENTALNFVAHAKAHIILLSAAMLAAQFNLTYGWDFNGILVPALLAMLWLTPLKLLATLGEAIIVLYLTKGFLKLPVIRHMDVAGPRKIVLVFTLAFLWKLALGFAIAGIAPEFKTSDVYGFGYLLSSLLSVKMLSKKSVRAVLLPSLTASAGGFAIGSVAGFLLELVSPATPPARQLAEAESHRLDRSPIGVMTVARMAAAGWSEDPEPPTQAELGRLEKFWNASARWELAEDGSVAQRDGMAAKAINAYEQKIGDADLAKIAGPSQELRTLGLGLGLDFEDLGEVDIREKARAGTVLDPEPRRWWVVREQGALGQRGWPTGILSPSGKGPVIVVPMPASEAPTAEAAAVMCRRRDCRAVLIAGREQLEAGTRINPRPLEVAMRAFADDPIVVLRGDLPVPEAYAEPGAQAELASELVPWYEDGAEVTGLLERDELEDLRGAAMAELRPLRGIFDLGQPWPLYRLEWDLRSTVVGIPPRSERFVLMRVAVPALEAMVVAGLDEFGADWREPPEPAPSLALPKELEAGLPKVAGAGAGAELPDDLGAPKTALIAELERLRETSEPSGHGGELYREPSDAELIVLEQLIVSPLIDWVERSELGDPLPIVTQTWAELVGYEIAELGDCDPAANAVPKEAPEQERDPTKPAPRVEECVVVLRDTLAPLTSSWGTLVLRRGGEWSMLIEVPRPHRERDTWRVGAELWQISPARALLLAGADGRADEPASSERMAIDPTDIAYGPDPVIPGNLQTPFQAMHMALHRATNVDGAAPVLQLRGIAAYRDLDAEVVVGRGQPELEPVAEEACIQDLDEPLASLVRGWGGGCQVADGSQDLYLLSGAGVPQLEYSRELGDGRKLRVVWLSAGIRERFHADRGTTELRGLAQVGVPVIEFSELERLRAPLVRRVDFGPPDSPIRDAEVGYNAYLAALDLADEFAATANLHTLRQLQETVEAAPDLSLEAGVGVDWGVPTLILEFAGSGGLGARSLVLLEHGLHGNVSLPWPELRDDLVNQLRVAAMARPRVLSLREVPIVEPPRVDDGARGEGGEGEDSESEATPEGAGE
ncbi:hypothetical protein PPSIR1_06758 [Plesiocystis pacifica SIR-1]|uniref:Capsule biosynthesis CapC n=1 Tax=Plesiocystis pacifica SIR-1 TaxID=391625 RepID=A6GDK5_9BACT|nr:poly-gamma-glutamate biosynthesis protein PgsC/CapC [Plesiocystis pacifica]EDM76048.1 hypothetical protein PPSIR1_06758 [Plesiocystis pacifica SIR-1]